MSYRTIEEYDREHWEGRVQRAVEALLERAEGDHTWYPVADILPFGAVFDPEGARELPPAFSVRMSYVEHLAYGPDRSVRKLTGLIVDAFMADKKWRQAQPRIQLTPLSGPCFEIRVWDENRY
jgi:hypothetical protein